MISAKATPRAGEPPYVTQHAAYRFVAALPGAAEVNARRGSRGWLTETSAPVSTPGVFGTAACPDTPANRAAIEAAGYEVEQVYAGAVCVRE